MRRVPAARLGVGLILLLPGALTAHTAFQAGGFFAGTPAVLVVIVGLGLVARTTLAEHPFQGFGKGLAVVTVALAFYCAWILLSVSWSDAPARALIDFNRALLYLLVLVLLGSLPRKRAYLAWAVRGVALAMVAICAVALVTRLFPDAIDVAPAVADKRLSYPLTYWNALGLMAAVGLVLCMHFTASEREPAILRVLGAGAVPVLATTLYFTFSRGGAGVALLGLVVYAVVAHPRSLILGLMAAGPATVVALMSAYDADLLAGAEPRSMAAAAQGEEVAVVVGVCIVAALALRVLGLVVDARLRRIPVSTTTRKRAATAAAAAAVVLALVAVVGLEAPAKVADQVEGFTEPGFASSPEDRRGRLTDVRNNGRIEQWRVALEAFDQAPIRGDGAGKFAHRWARDRDNDLKVEDAHSVYLESLAELGLVGGLLIVVTLAMILGAFAARARGEQRHLYAALLGVALAWAVHAGVDWDWEMPAVTLWLFALGGMALAVDRERAPAWAPPRLTRVVAALACLALLVPAGGMALSQLHLNRSVEGLKSGDCEGAVHSALASTRAMPVRPEPFEVLGFCDVRLGNADLGVQMLEAAIKREPDSWVLHYGLALVRGTAGRDPRPAARRALELNPLEPLARNAVKIFRTNDPQKWRRRASTARLPIL